MYKFGTKRIFVKVEYQTIIIRVGGGYMNIDDFLNIFTPLEVQKLESGYIERAVSSDQLERKLKRELSDKFLPCLGLIKK